MTRHLACIFFRLFVVLLLTLVAVSAQALTFVVNTTNDSHDLAPGDGLCADGAGFCTLRAAIEEANASGGDSIVFAPTIETIRLTLGALIVTSSDLSIIGVGGQIRIDGALNPEGTDILDVRGANVRITGLIIANSRRNGIIVRGTGVRIGESGRITSVIGNGQGDTSAAGIAIVGVDSADALIANVWAGLSGNGTMAVPNQTGMSIRHSSFVTIGSIGGGNVIGGNYRDGIVVSDMSHDVTIISNCIGLDVSRRNEAPNGRSGIVIRGGSTDVIVGGVTKEARNVVSANLGNGVSLSGFGTRENLIASNLIGLDSSGFFEAGNHGTGISVTHGAKCNRIGFDSLGVAARLVVAGSHGNGIEIIGQGTDSNQIDWTYVGSDARGDGDRPNGAEYGQGIEISGGAKHNLIGSDQTMPRNVVVGNYGPGVAIAGFGTEYNTVIGNYVGVYRLGNSPFGNSAGVVVRDSAQHNSIGSVTAGNLISGNRGDLFPLGAGVVIFGSETKFNTVQRNLIGTDYTGTRTLRNRSAGVVIGGGATNNLIGGDSTTGNQISGNGTVPISWSLAGGVHIFGQGTDFNEISGNLIGVAADKATPLGNNGHGIGIFGGASHTSVGGDSPAKRNIIVGNKHSGIWIEGIGTTDNFVRFNSIFSNDSGGIVLLASANGSILPPSIVSATTDSIWGSAEAFAVVDIYTARVGKLGRIGGANHVGQTISGADGSFSCIASGLVVGDSITAVQSVSGKGSSAFAQLALVAAGENNRGDSSGSNDQPVLYQNQPNPFNSSTVIHYSLSSGDSPRLDIFNTAGQRVRYLPIPYQQVGEHYIAWDGTNDQGEQVASGTYFFRLSSGGTSLTKKMLLLK